MTNQNLSRSLGPSTEKGKNCCSEEEAIVGTEYQTYREALSLIRYGLNRSSQIEAFDFLTDIYKKSPNRLKTVFVMALISTLTSFNFTDVPLSQEGAGGLK